MESSLQMVESKSRNIMVLGLGNLSPNQGQTSLEKVDWIGLDLGLFPSSLISAYDSMTSVRRFLSQTCFVMQSVLGKLDTLQFVTIEIHMD